MLTLFYAPNTCALASHITLEEAGAAYEAKRLNFAENEQRKPEYLKINPKSRVPALVTDQGILTETPAILVYIAQMFPKANLLPSTIRSAWRKSSPSTATSARPCMWPMPIACAAIAGPMMSRQWKP